MLSTNGKRPWYIHDQEWYVLTDSSLARELIRPELLRAGRLTDVASSGELANAASQWEQVRSRDAIAMSESYRCRSGNELPTQRLVLVSDAGLGKTAATEWLEYRLNQPEPPGSDVATPRQRELTFRFVLASLIRDYRFRSKDTVLENLITALANDWSDRCSSEGVELDESYARIQLESLLRQNRLTVIIDGLDQAGSKDFDVLHWILKEPRLKNLRLIVAGRSSVIHTHWKNVFSVSDWTYVRVDDFTRSQQVRYLGWLPVPEGREATDDDLRYRAIDRDARDILSVPRVLSYLYEQETFDNLRTPSAIYRFAIDRMISEGLAREYTTVDDADCRALMDLLSVIAYETIAFFRVESDAPFQPVVNANGSWTFDQIPHYDPEGWLNSEDRLDYQFEMHAGDESHGDFNELKRNILQRYRSIDDSRNFTDDWDQLVRINAILNGGIFDDNRFGLNQIVWANRSLHEFLLAYFFANHAIEKETYGLWDWIYIERHPTTDQYYPFWMFLCEMPSEHRNSLAWLRSIRLLYQGCFQSGDQRFAKRSTEMIYRSWEPLNALRKHRRADPRKLANRILVDWQSEFETAYCKGRYGEPLQQIANGLRESYFMEIKGGPLTMGTLPEIAFPSEDREHWRNEFDEWVERVGRGDDPFRDLLDEYNWNSRGDQRYRENYEGKVNAALAANDFEGYLRARFEIGKEAKCETSVGDFELGRTTVSNEQYRLFDPGHGLETDRSTYQQYSETDAHPAIRISFFDAWVYSQWLFWDGQASRLPWEAEWEYAVKLGFQPDEWYRPHWWDEDQEMTDFANCEASGHRKTLIPNSQRASQASRQLDPLNIGLCDMLGNVWEWCQDIFRNPYRRRMHDVDRAGNATVSRVLRGGSFSVTGDVRCSYRYIFTPSDSNNSSSGFELPGLQKENLKPSPLFSFFRERSERENLAALPHVRIHFRQSEIHQWICSTGSTIARYSSVGYRPNSFPACCVAAVSTIQTTFVVRIAITTRHRIATTTTGFELPAHFSVSMLRSENGHVQGFDQRIFNTPY